jgi:hypothetical protein
MFETEACVLHYGTQREVRESGLDDGQHAKVIATDNGLVDCRHEPLFVVAVGNRGRHPDLDHAMFTNMFNFDHEKSCLPIFGANTMRVGCVARYG